jgi:hypothetical protein
MQRFIITSLVVMLLGGTVHEASGSVGPGWSSCNDIRHIAATDPEYLPWLMGFMTGLVVYSTAADNSISAKIHYNALSSPPSAGALPWCRLSFSTTSGLWLWCAFSSCSARCGPVGPTGGTLRYDAIAHISFADREFGCL